MQTQNMQLLFVHGMGGTPFDWFPNAIRLKRLGYEVSAFSYLASFLTRPSIKENLRSCLKAMALRGNYTVIGHSLGGVLLPDVLQDIPADFCPPVHLFLVGSPIMATQLNQSLSRFFIYRLLFGQCGALVASHESMNEIGIPDVSTTCVVGRRDQTLADGNNSDGMVLESELRTDLFDDVVRLESCHPLMPANLRLSDIIVRRVSAREDH